MFIYLNMSYREFIKFSKQHRIKMDLRQGFIDQHSGQLWQRMHKKDVPKEGRTFASS